MAGDSPERDMRTFMRDLVARQERFMREVVRELRANTEIAEQCARAVLEMRDELREHRIEMREQRAEMREQRAEMRAGREALFRMLDRLPPPEPEGA